jgi:hypothetical protein
MSIYGLWREPNSLDREAGITDQHVAGALQKQQ